ncbi:phospholipase D-like domain-containing protein [Zavarzinella formosa]|uniref:hypothetical protein n=1 Tax=Zavarzinella formosa TaxID=360055 RepID=UPI00036E20CE|nr:hypothetical protein [Zavarzinella formosa]
MHTHTLRTKYTFGDRVRFNSHTQGIEGTGKIFAITVDSEGQIDYIVDIGRGEYSELQNGIYEDEIISLV